MDKIIKKFPYIPYLCAFLLSLLYFLYHFHFMQQFICWDQTIYLNYIIESIDNNTIKLLNAHHLHMEPGGVLFHKIMFALFGPAGFTDVVFNNRIRSLVSACIGIYFVVLYLRNITGKLSWGLIGGLLIAFCHGFLAYSTRVETAIYPVTGIILALWVFNKLETAKKYNKILSITAGIILFANIMFHQYTAIACVIFCLLLLLPPQVFSYPFSFFKAFQITKHKQKAGLDRSIKTRLICFLLVVVVALALTGAAYYLIGCVVFRLPIISQEDESPYSFYNSFQYWLLKYGNNPGWGQGFKEFNPKDSFWGFTDAYISQADLDKAQYDDYNFNYYFADLSDDKSLIHNLTALFYISGILGLICTFFSMWQRYKRSLLLIIFSLILFTLFFTYWEPYYFEFWLVPCLLCSILSILFLNLICEKLTRVLTKFIRYPLLAGILFFALLLGTHNTKYYIAPFSRSRVLWSYKLEWEPEYYMKLFSDYIYIYPSNPYKIILEDIGPRTTYKKYFFKVPHW